MALLDVYVMTDLTVCTAGMTTYAWAQTPEELSCLFIQMNGSEFGFSSLYSNILELPASASMTILVSNIGFNEFNATLIVARDGA